MTKLINKLFRTFGFQLNRIENRTPIKNQIQLTTIDELRLRGAFIGENVHILDNCIIDPDHCFHIHIGDNVTLAPNVHILAHDASTKKFIGYTKVKNTFIGNNVFIGAGSLILPGVRIEDNCIVAAGSVVNKDVSKNSVIGGNPIKLITTTEEYLKKVQNQMNDQNTFDIQYTYEFLNREKKSERVKSASQNNVIFIP